MTDLDEASTRGKTFGAFVVTGAHGHALKHLLAALKAETHGDGIDRCIVATGYLTEEEAARLAFGLLKGLPWEIASQVTDAAVHDQVGPVDTLLAESLMGSARIWAQSASELEIRAHVHEGVKRMAPRSVAKLRAKIG